MLVEGWPTSTQRRATYFVKNVPEGRTCVFVCVCVCVYIYIYIYIYIQGVSRLEGVTAAGDFLGLCDQKSSYKHVSDFGRLRSYDRLKLGIEGNDY